jgi:NADP-dependent 3-hydroxy acid dehydrogenase YdfG
MGQLDKKIAWVTGAGTGIGEAAAIALAEEGATVVLTGRRKEPLDAAAKRIGSKASVEAADLTDAKAVDAVVQRIVAKFSRLDILVNNAGMNILERTWKNISPEGIDALVHGNLSSAFYCARAVLPQMRAQGGGQLIHTASMAGRNISPLSGPGYTAAKHAVVAMSHTINMEDCVNNIRSTAVLPGEVNTPILKNRPNPLNEVWITPTWNRSYVAQLQRAAL